jgi:hypothetical protein
LSSGITCCCVVGVGVVPFSVTCLSEHQARKSVVSTTELIRSVFMGIKIIIKDNISDTLIAKKLILHFLFVYEKELY